MHVVVRYAAPIARVFHRLTSLSGLELLKNSMSIIILLPSRNIPMWSSIIHLAARRAALKELKMIEERRIIARLADSSSAFLADSPVSGV